MQHLNVDMYVDLVAPSQESVIPDIDKNNDHLLKGTPKDKLHEHCSNEKISPLLVSYNPTKVCRCILYLSPQKPPCI